jgi:hypothetical protein
MDCRSHQLHSYHIWQPSKYGHTTDAILSQVRQTHIANQQNLTLPAITSSCKYIKMWPKPYGALDFSFWQVLVLYLSMIEITDWAYIEGQSPWLYDWDASVFIAASLYLPSPLYIPCCCPGSGWVPLCCAMDSAGSARTVGLVHSFSCYSTLFPMSFADTRGKCVQNGLLFLAPFYWFSARSINLAVDSHVLWCDVRSFLAYSLDVT